MARHPTLSPQSGTPEQRAILAIAQHLKRHQQALENIKCREAQTAQHLEALSKLQAETRLIRMDLNTYVTDVEFAAMHDRVSALEKTAETPQQREQRQSKQRSTVLWVGCCICASGLLIAGYLAVLSGRVALLESAYRQLYPQQTHPGRTP